MVARSLVISLVTMTLLWSAWSVQAVVVNGGFETGSLVGWQTIGDVSLQTASIGVAPTEGATMVFLTTLCDSTKERNPGTCQTTLRELPYSPNNAVPSWDPYRASLGIPTELGGFFGVSLDDIRPFLLPPEIVQRTFPGGEGSAIKQVITGQAGDQLAFDAYYATTDPFDEAFVILLNDFGVQSLTFLNPFSGPNPSRRRGSRSPVDIYCRRDFDSGLGGRDCPGVGSVTVGWQHFSIGLPSTGTFTVGFGLWEVTEGTQPSAILIDNVTFTAVPEPGTAALLGGGLLLGWLGRRSIRRSSGRLRRLATDDQALPG